MCPDGQPCLQADCSYCTVQCHLLTDMTGTKADTTHTYTVLCNTQMQTNTSLNCQNCLTCIEHIQPHTLSEHTVSSLWSKCQVTGCTVVCSQAKSRLKRGARFLLLALNKTSQTKTSQGEVEQFCELVVILNKNCVFSLFCPAELFTIDVST